MKKELKLMTMLKKVAKKEIIFSVALLGLAGCSSTVMPTKLYQLPLQVTQIQTVLSDIKDPIWIDRIYVADFLAQQGIVYQLDEVQYQVANNHQWMTPLANQVQQKLKNDLTLLLPQKKITTQMPSNWSKKLNVEITAFQGTDSGEAKVAGTWILRTQRGQEVILPFSCVKPLDKDGYASLVQTLALCFEQEEASLARYL